MAALPLAALLLLGGCLSMPGPFSNPGRDASALAHNAPPSRLDIPTPTESLLPEAGARQWAWNTATALLGQTIPAMAQPTRPGDWWLSMRAELRDGQVVPIYQVMTPKNQVRATQEGAPVPAALWSGAQEPVLSAAAQDAAPRIASVLTGIQADDMEKDPHSLKHRAARVYFSGVSGAPGDGNTALAQAFAASFRDGADTIQNSAENADFTVTCTVKITDGPAGTTGHPQQHIEIVWRVQDKAGKEAGAATQLHDIAAHSLDGYWGDVAVAAAQEAAGGVRQIIGRYSGRDNAPLPTAGAPAATPAATPAPAPPA
ncbi:hypothetical protein K2X14_08230 [Acetobacter sp. TBRC 12305]|uniref:Lipoprotein n=1 Tax=Acetobacter garciniae TaxID=2817435 RepID=A0A939KN30_9PROT|nr:hypothetical protein [Acetobacter garciniae]MBX0344819.1 hypothetical protein [Acetobacter garciniae]